MHEPVWEFLIVNYLFLGGLSAGLYFVSGLATWFQEDGQSAFPRHARWGALLAHYRSNPHINPALCDEWIVEQVFDKN